MTTDFTMDDLYLLMEALEAWEQKDVAGQMMADLIGVISGDDKESEENRREERWAKYASDNRVRKERSILLRAKIVQYLDTKRAELLSAEVDKK